jgi:hypothetical protein
MESPTKGSTLLVNQECHIQDVTHELSSQLVQGGPRGRIFRLGQHRFEAELPLTLSLAAVHR